MSSTDKGKAPIEQVNSIQNFEDILINVNDILINVNEYCEVVNEKIEVAEEIIVNLRADLEKVRELTTYFHQTIE